MNIIYIIILASLIAAGVYTAGYSEGSGDVTAQHEKDKAKLHARLVDSAEKLKLANEKLRANIHANVKTITAVKDPSGCADAYVPSDIFERVR